MELEKEGCLPYLSTLQQRRNDSSLDVIVYRKPKHTDQYLDFQSHHPPRVKKRLVRCLYDRVRSITSTQEHLQKEECHLHEVLKQNSYTVNCICTSSLPPRQDVGNTQALALEEGGRPQLVLLPYMEGVIEDIR